MPMRSSSSMVLGFLLLSAPALAGDVYTFAVDQQGTGHFFVTPGTLVANGNRQGKVFLDGRKYRMELKPGPESTIADQAMISKDGGAHEIALDLKGHTFYEPKTPNSTSSLLRLLPVDNGSVTNVKLDAMEAPEPEMVSGIQTRRHEIKLSYDITVELRPPAGIPQPVKVRPEIVHGKVTVDATYWLAAGGTPVLPKLLRPEIHTGFPEIDSRLDDAIAALQGIPVKQQMTISTEGDQGTAPQTSLRTVTLQGHKTQQIKASAFEIPAGFKMHEPEFSGPGLGPLPPQ